MKSNSVAFLFILISSVFFNSCSKNDDVNPADEIVLELLNKEVELPAKVKLFFKADRRNGDPLAGLDESNFQLFEDGDQLSEFESGVQIQREPGEFMFSSVLLLDLSGSILNADALSPLKNSAKSFVESVIPENTDPLSGSFEMSIYWFDGESNIHQLVDFTMSREDLISGIESIDVNISNDNSTNLNGAVVQGVEIMKNRLIEQSSEHPDVSIASSMVIFTDGTDQAGIVSDQEAISAVNNSGNDITTFTIGLGGEINQNILKSLGSEGFELSDNTTDLNDSFIAVAQKVKDEANSFYVLEYCSPSRAGNNILKIVTEFNDFSGSFETSFDATGFTGGCSID